MSGITKKSLNAFYYACSYAKADYSKFMNVTTSMVRQVMPEFSCKKNVIILCDSWYVKKDLVCVVDEYKIYSDGT